MRATLQRALGLPAGEHDPLVDGVVFEARAFASKGLAPGWAHRLMMASDGGVSVGELVSGFGGQLVHSHSLHHLSAIRSNDGGTVISHSPAASGATGISEAIVRSAVGKHETHGER